MVDVTYIVTILTSVVSATLAFILQGVIKENRRLKLEKEVKQNAREKALENGVMCLLRDNLISHHSKYTNRGHISSNGLSNWLLMYEAYTTLGGNGLVEHLKTEVEDLPVK